MTTHGTPSAATAACELRQRVAEAVGRGRQAELLGGEPADALAVHRQPRGARGRDHAQALGLEVLEHGRRDRLDLRHDEQLGARALALGLEQRAQRLRRRSCRSRRGGRRPASPARPRSDRRRRPRSPGAWPRARPRGRARPSRAGRGGRRSAVFGVPITIPMSGGRTIGAPGTLAAWRSASILDGAGTFFDAVGSFFDSLASVDFACRCCSGWSLFVAYLSLRAQALHNTLRAAYPGEPIPYRRIWGAYIAAYGFNNVVPGARRRRDQALPRQDVGAGLELPGGRRDVRGRGHLRPDDRDPGAAVRVHAGRLPQAAGLLAARRVRPVVLRLQPAAHAVRASRASPSPLLALFACALAARRRVLAQRAPGAHRAARPPPVPPRGLARAVRRLAAALHGVLVPARRVRRRRLGAQRAARARRQRGRRARAVHARAARACSRRCSSRSSRRSASGATVAAYSVGQQIAIASVSLAVGFGALFFVFGFRSFRDVRTAGREHRRREKAGAVTDPPDDCTVGPIVDMTRGHATAVLRTRRARA